MPSRRALPRSDWALLLCMAQALAGCSRWAPNSTEAAKEPAGEAESLPAPSSQQAASPAPLLPLRSVAFSPNGASLAVGGEGQTLLLDTSSYAERLRVKGSRGHNYASFLPDGRLVTQGYRDNRSLLWEASTGALLANLSGAAICADTFGAAWRCSDASRGVRLRYLSSQLPREAVLEAWDGASFQERRKALDRQLGHIDVALAISKRGAFAVGSAGGYLQIEPNRRPWPVVEPGPNGATPACPLPSPDDQIINGGYLRVWSDAGALKCQRLGLGKKVRSLAFSPRGERLLAGDEGGQVFLLDASSCEVLGTFSGHASPVLGVAFSPSAEVAASIEEEGGLSIWDLATGARVALSFTP